MMEEAAKGMLDADVPVLMRKMRSSNLIDAVVDFYII
jgi:hypothetical protein